MIKKENTKMNPVEKNTAYEEIMKEVNHD